MSAGLLEARGETKGRFYVATAGLIDMRSQILGARKPLRDPYDAGEQLEITGMVGSPESTR